MQWFVQEFLMYSLAVSWRGAAVSCVFLGRPQAAILAHVVGISWQGAVVVFQFPGGARPWYNF